MTNGTPECGTIFSQFSEHNYPDEKVEMLQYFWFKREREGEVGVLFDYIYVGCLCVNKVPN